MCSVFSIIGNVKICKISVRRMYVLKVTAGQPTGARALLTSKQAFYNLSRQQATLSPYEPDGTCDRHCKLKYLA